MADGSASDNPAEDSRPTPPASRAARRKVDLEGSRADAGTETSGRDGSGGRADGAASAAGGRARVVKKPPLYRRGGFWFWVILAEVAVALFLSYRFEPSLDTIDPAGADVAAFCASVTSYREASAASLTVDISQVSSEFAKEAEAYRTLRAQGPTELQPDFDKLIRASVALEATARDVAAKKAADPNYIGGAEAIGLARDEQAARTEVPSRRFTLAVKNLCGIDLDATISPPSGTAPAAPTSVAPTSSPAAPGTSTPSGGGTPPTSPTRGG